MARSFLTCDVEAIVDPTLPTYTPKPGGDAFPAAPYWQVACIGMLSADSELRTTRIGVVKAAGEAAILRGFAGYVDDKQPDLVTFNGRGFDLPVITARCLRHGIPFERRFQRDVSYRYTTDGHMDVADFLSDYGAGRAATLDVWSKLIGLPGKMDVAGADVATLIADGRIEDVETYCMTDVVSTWALALRTELVRGLSREACVAGLTSLLAAVDAMPRLRPFVDAIDRRKLLLVEEEGAGGFPIMAFPMEARG